jgi:acetyl-CoA C-acetyltransferase
MTKPEVLIVGGARTPMTDYVGALKDVSALELGAIASRGASVGRGPEWIDRRVRQRPQTSANAIYSARHVAQGRRPWTCPPDGERLWAPAFKRPSAARR